jgi:hypothetical protein
MEIFALLVLVEESFSVSNEFKHILGFTAGNYFDFN